MNRKWEIIPNSRPGLNRITLELEPTKEGYKRWINAGDKDDFKYFLNEKFITNLEYLEGIILLEELDDKHEAREATSTKIK